MPSFSVPLSGLNANSAALSAISNNLANLNTVGYKTSETEFHDLFYQNLGTGGDGTPIQMGVGSAVASMMTQFTQGSTESNGIASNVAIQGGGFFVTSKDGEAQYTRAGDFTADAMGELVTPEGAKVLGYPATGGVVNTNIAPGPLTVAPGQLMAPQATSNISLDLNLDASAAVGANFTASVPVYDSLGAAHTLTMNFNKTGVNQWSYDVNVPAADLGQSGPAVSVASGTMTFDATGAIQTPAGGSVAVAVNGLADGANPLSLTWSTGAISQQASPSNTSGIHQDGFQSGRLTSYTIANNGVIEGSFNNGQTLAIGQLCLASFADQNGLEKLGGNAYRATLGSGPALVGVPGAGGRGTVTGGALELSNVDIASEFSKLIVAQRGFQASARAITTFDEIAQDTINLKH